MVDVRKLLAKKQDLEVEIKSLERDCEKLYSELGLKGSESITALGKLKEKAEKAIQDADNEMDEIVKVLSEAE